MPRSIQWIAGFCTLGVYYFISYHIEQDEFSIYFSGYSIAFGIYLLLIRYLDRISFSFWLVSGVIIRGVLLFNFPNLSDDIYRFFWDAGIAAEGWNPFELKPSEFDLHSLPENIVSAYPLMNSPDYYSVYPPLLQYIFQFCYTLSDGSISQFTFIYKCLAFFCELLSIVGIITILKHLNWSIKRSLIYILNPLIIIELMSNAHPEVFLIPFFVLLIWGFRCQNNWWILGWTGAISIKINPLLFGPFLLLQNFSWNRILQLTFALVAVGLPFVYMFSAENILHFVESLRLYYQTFEFNGSIYLIARFIGYQINGYNSISTIGPLLLIVAALTIGSLSILYYRFNDKRSIIRLAEFMSHAWLIYLLTSSIVHPWYLVLLVPLAIFSRLRYPLVWSYTVGLSYYTYSNELDLPVIFSVLEYSALLLAFILDIRLSSKSIKEPISNHLQ